MRASRETADWRKVYDQEGFTNRFGGKVEVERDSFTKNYANSS